MKYQNSIIYKLICNKTQKIYYGSTINTLQKRKDNHRQHYKLFLKGERNYITSFEIIKDDDFIIELVEKYPCNSKKELEEREKYYILNNDCINKYIPTRTSKEYYLDNKEHCNNKSKEDYQKNKEKYDILNKEWAKNNIEKVKEHKKKYKLNLGLYTCICGVSCKNSNWDIKRHNESKKHLDFNKVQVL